MFTIVFTLVRNHRFPAGCTIEKALNNLEAIANGAARELFAELETKCAKFLRKKPAAHGCKVWSYGSKIWTYIN